MKEHHMILESKLFYSFNRETDLWTCHYFPVFDTQRASGKTMEEARKNLEKALQKK